MDKERRRRLRSAFLKAYDEVLMMYSPYDFDSNIKITIPEENHETRWKRAMKGVTNGKDTI